MPASWEFLLCQNGNPIAELTTASGKQLKYSRNQFTEAQLVISHLDAAATPLMEAIEGGPLPTLKAYRRSEGALEATLRFNGHFAPSTETLEETKLITAMFRSPFGRLHGDGTSGMGRYTGASIQAEEKEQGQIAKSLILLYGGGGTIGAEDPTFGVKYAETSFAGLGIGSIATDGVVRSITYPHANVGQAIVNLSACLNGFDFDETFVDEGETLAKFNTYTGAGSSRPSARFEYGRGTLANVSHVSRSTRAPANVVRLIGSRGLWTQVEDAGSIAQYGKWYYVEQATDCTSMSVLKSRAEAILARSKVPIRTYSITPELGLPNCPDLFDDFFLADTVPFFAREGAFNVNTETRIDELTVVIDDNGFEATSIPDPHATTPESPDALHTVFRVQA